MPLPADRFLRWAALLAFFGAWQVLGSALDATTLPPPHVVFARLWLYIDSGELPFHLGMTLFRVAASFLIALAVGTVIGILMGRFTRLDAMLDGLLVLGLNIPALVTVILCFVWFGLTEVAAVAAVALNKIPTVVVTVREGARAIDRQLLEVADAFALPPPRKLAKVYLPQLYPYLMAASRSGLSLIWKIVLVVELLGRSNGVGFQLAQYFQFFDVPGILAYTLAFAGVVLLVEAVMMRPLERRLSGWRG